MPLSAPLVLLKNICTVVALGAPPTAPRTNIAAVGSRVTLPNVSAVEVPAGVAVTVENPVSVHDFHATLLHLLGIDHHRLAVQFQGLDVRLTGVTGDVVRPLLA